MAIDEKEIIEMQERLTRAEDAFKEFQARLDALEAERKQLFVDTLKQLDEQTIHEIMSKLNAKQKPAA